jgi:hypothetical protein
MLTLTGREILGGPIKAKRHRYDDRFRVSLAKTVNHNEAVQAKEDGLIFGLKFKKKKKKKKN